LVGQEVEKRRVDFVGVGSRDVVRPAIDLDRRASAIRSVRRAAA
jgi:hypothetical protein